MTRSHYIRKIHLRDYRWIEHPPDLAPVPVTFLWEWQMCNMNMHLIPSHLLFKCR